MATPVMPRASTALNAKVKKVLIDRHPLVDQKPAGAGRLRSRGRTLPAKFFTEDFHVNRRKGRAVGSVCTAVDGKPFQGIRSEFRHEAERATPTFFDRYFLPSAAPLSTYNPGRLQ